LVNRRRRKESWDSHEQGSPHAVRQKSSANTTRPGSRSRAFTSLSSSYNVCVVLRITRVWAKEQPTKDSAKIHATTNIGCHARHQLPFCLGIHAVVFRWQRLLKPPFSHELRVLEMQPLSEALKDMCEAYVSMAAGVRMRRYTAHQESGVLQVSRRRRRRFKDTTIYYSKEDAIRRRKRCIISMTALGIIQQVLHTTKPDRATPSEETTPDVHALLARCDTHHFPAIVCSSPWPQHLSSSQVCAVASPCRETSRGDPSSSAHQSSPAPILHRASKHLSHAHALRARLSGVPLRFRIELRTKSCVISFSASRASSSGA
jgi:hypothetical protein